MSYRRLYTTEEDTKIVEYIIANNFYYILRGNTAWQTMEKNEVCPGRTWQSLKERFKKVIINNLFRLKISAIEKNNIRTRYRITVDSDDNIVKTQSKKSDANENLTESSDISQGSGNAKRRKTIDSELQSKRGTTENINKDVRQHSHREFRYNLRRSNLMEADTARLESSPTINKNIIEREAGDTISEDIEDSDDSKAESSKKKNSSRRKKKKNQFLWDTPYSSEEDRQIVLFFKRYIGSLRSPTIYQTLQQVCGLRRTPNSLRRRFMYDILPKLHTYKELSYLDMIAIYDCVDQEIPIEVQELINKDIESRSSQSTLDELEIINKVKGVFSQSVTKSIENEITNITQKHTSQTDNYAKRTLLFEATTSNFKTFEKEVVSVVPTDNQNVRLESTPRALVLPPAISATDKMFESENPGNKSTPDSMATTSSLVETVPVITCLDNNMCIIMMKTGKRFGNAKHAFVLNENPDLPYFETHLKDELRVLPRNIHIVDNVFFETFRRYSEASINFKKEIAKICQSIHGKEIPEDNLKLMVKNDQFFLCYPKKRLHKKQHHRCLKKHHQIQSTNDTLSETRIHLDEIVLNVSHSETEFDSARMHKNNSTTSQNSSERVETIRTSIITDPNEIEMDSPKDRQTSSNMSLIEPCNQGIIQNAVINELEEDSSQESSLNSLETSQITKPCNQYTINELDLGSSSKEIPVDSQNLDKIQNVISDEMDLGSTQDDVNNHASQMESYNLYNIQILSINEMDLGSSSDDSTKKTSTKINQKESCDQGNIQNISVNEMDLGLTQDNPANKTSLKMNKEVQQNQTSEINNHENDQNIVSEETVESQLFFSADSSTKLSQKTDQINENDGRGLSSSEEVQNNQTSKIYNNENEICYSPCQNVVAEEIVESQSFFTPDD